MPATLAQPAADHFNRAIKMVADAPTAALPILLAPKLRAPRGGFAFEGRAYRGGSYLPRAARAALEAHAVKAARASSAEPVTIGVLGFDYRLRATPCSASFGTHGFTLTPAHKAGEAYVVLHSHEGETSCSCPDWHYRKKGTGRPCKHTARLIELGLIPASRPTVLPPFAHRGLAAPPTIPPPEPRPTLGPPSSPLL